MLLHAVTKGVSCIYKPEEKQNVDSGSSFLVKNMLSGMIQDSTALYVTKSIHIEL